jgi:hypothetical protein
MKRRREYREGWVYWFDKLLTRPARADATRLVRA